MMPLENYHEKAGSRLFDAIRWLDIHGETPFTSDQCDQLFVDAYQEVSVKPFIPTFLKTNEPGNGTLPVNALELGIEIGGTKNRATIGKTNDNAMLSQLPGVERPFTSKEFSDPDHFFSTVADIGKPVIEQIKTLGETHAYHVIFSFDGITHETSYGIDVTPKEHMSKGFVVPGIGEINVGEMMWKHYKMQGLSIPRDAIMIVPNDGAATLLNYLYAHASLIDGTGIGGAIAIRDAKGIYRIYNMEIGELTCFPLSSPEQEVHTKGKSVKRHLEMIAGGESMGNVLDTIIRHLADEGVIPYTIRAGKKFDTKYMSDILANNRTQFHTIFNEFNEHDEETWKILTNIALRQCYRASQALGITYAALILAYPQSFPEKEILIPVEGSNFWKTQDFPAMVHDVIERYIHDHTVKFVQTSGSLGATYAALRWYDQLQLSG